MSSSAKLAYVCLGLEDIWCLGSGIFADFCNEMVLVQRCCSFVRLAVSSDSSVRYVVSVFVLPAAVGLVFLSFSFGLICFLPLTFVFR